MHAKKYVKFLTRRLARSCALQALYSWQLSKNDFLKIENFVISIQSIQNFDISYFHELYFGVISCISDLDKLIISYVSDDLKKINYVEYAILLIALFELTRCYSVPYKVVINEAIELAKIFGSEKSYTFINSVLDKIATEKLNIVK